MYTINYKLTATLGTNTGFIPPLTIKAFYEEYHKQLCADGVDGVKVDNQVRFLSCCDLFRLSKRLLIRHLLKVWLTNLEDG